MSTIFATLTVYDSLDKELVLDLTGYYNPAQNGGWDEPSWSAYIDGIQALYPDGSKYALSKLELQMAEEALWDALEGKWECQQDLEEFFQEEEGIRKTEMEYEDRMYGGM